MRRKLLGSVCVAAITLAFPAQALASPGSNTSIIDQSGNGQTAAVDQPGANDTSIVIQSNSGNTVTSTQAGVVGGASEVRQSGVGNTANVTQSDDGNNPGPLNKPVAKSFITQTGDANTTTVDQIAQYAFGVSTSTVVQFGGSVNAGNIAGVTQRDSSQTSTITQFADNNLAVVSQGTALSAPTNASAGNFSDVYQGGTGLNQASVTQTGTNGRSFVTQLGFNDNPTIITNVGFNDNATITQQGGDGAFSQVTQSDSGETVTSIQTGSGHFSTILQATKYNTATLEQRGSANSSSIVQDTNGIFANSSYTFDVAQVYQAGVSDVSHVTQLGRADASIIQVGANDTSTLTQEGLHANATVFQGGNNNSSIWYQSATSVDTNDPNNIIQFGGVVPGVYQQGNNDLSIINQTGSYQLYFLTNPFVNAPNSVDVRQLGSNVSSLINQGRANNQADVFQEISDSRSEIDQSGGLNAAFVVQGSMIEDRQVSGNWMGRWQSRPLERRRGAERGGLKSGQW